MFARKPCSHRQFPRPACWTGIVVILTCNYVAYGSWSGAPRHADAEVPWNTQYTCGGAPVSGVAPFTVTCRSGPGDFSPTESVTLGWDFGDGSVDDGDDVDHTFTAPGDYWVRLSVTDPGQPVGTGEVLVTVLPEFHIVWAAEADAPPEEPVIRFSAESDDVPPDFLLTAGYHWILGDGNVAEGREVFHTFRSPGTYVVALSLTVGAVTVDCARQQVAIPANLAALPEREGGYPLVSPVAEAGPDQAIDDTEGAGVVAVSLDASASSSACCQIINYQWTSEDGTVLADGSSPLAEVELPVGEHTITLTVTDENQAISTDQTGVHVAAPGVLLVMPDDGLISTGPIGGPFVPGSKAYTLANTGGRSIKWGTSRTQAWVTASPANGTLAAGATVDVTMSIGSGAGSLPAGTHHAVVTFKNKTNGNGTTTRPATLTVTTTPDCPTSNTSWQNYAIPSQTGLFTAEFDATPAATNIDGVTGLSRLPGATYSDFAVLVRFNSAGTIDARNGGTYSAGTTIPYTAGTSYHFRLAVNVPAHTYNVYVTPKGGSEQALGANYAFRTEQLGVTELANWAIITGTGSHDVCDFTAEGGSAPGTLVVTPTDGLISSGAPGGPFAPSSKAFTLNNAGGVAINWTASKTQSWVSLSATGGSLAPSASATVTVSLNSGANSLPAGNYSDVVTFTNTTNGGGNTTRAVLLTVSGGQQTANAVTQNGITWTFNGIYPVGQFANGDWWVVGPVTITSITRPHNANGKDGSMVNPRPSAQGSTHGYDDQVGDYQASLDVARALPYTLATNASLISVISWVAGDPGCPGLVNGKPRPNLRSCAVLTCLPAAPPSGTLRPPYCGLSKPLYNTAQIRRNLLVRLTQVSSTPAMSTVEQYFARVWLDHVPNWPAQDYMHPSENMPWYGRELAGEIGDGALMLLLDRDDKETLLIRYVQLGIDLYGIASNGGYWAPNGGIAGGRKWPIVFGGLMLNNASMMNIGTTVMFQEDAQIFYVEETSPGVYNWGYGGYGPQDVGLPEWGIRHATTPSMDNKSWSADYRQCCTNTALVGQVLAARILGLRSSWNHDALFDYQDRYMITEQGDYRAWSSFVEQMWDQYRPSY